MSIFDRFDNIVTQAGVSLTAVGIVIALIAFFMIIGWGTRVTIPKLIIGALVAGAIITIVAKPDLFQDDLGATVSIATPGGMTAYTPAGAAPTDNLSQALPGGRL